MIKTKQITTRPTFYPILLIIISFLPPLIGRSYTHWDTFDLLTINFTFLSDSLKSGQLPIWNPFTLSGQPLLASAFFTNSLYSPIDLGLLLLSLIISPLYLMEINVILGAFLLFFGSYRLFHTYLFDKKTAAWISFTQVILLIHPIVGQISFIYSLSLFPWMLYFIIQKKHRNIFNTILVSIFMACLVAKSYFFYIFIFFSLALVISFWISRNQERPVYYWLLQKMPIFLIPTLFFLVLNLEGTLDYISQYKFLTGNLIIKEPRMRQIITEAPFLYPLNQIIRNLFRFKENGWTQMGFGIFIPFVVGYSLVSIKQIKRLIFIKIILLTLIIFFTFISSTTTISNIIYSLPILSSFRWAFYNIHFSIYLSIIFAGLGFQYVKKNDNYLQKIATNAFIICSCLISLFYGFKNSTIGGRKRTVYQPSKVKTRLQRTPIYTKNKRNLQHRDHFFYNDYSWLKTKQPFSHGYNNTISEYYWRMKDMPFNSRILNFSCHYYSKKNKKRSNFENDNQYIDYYLDKVDPSGRSYIIDKTKDHTCSPDKEKDFKFLNIKLKTNSLTFDTEISQPGIIAITQHLKEGWSAELDGRPAHLNTVNYIFQGIYLDRPGKHHVKLTYFPLTAKVLLLWYFLSIIFLISYYIKRRKEPFTK